MKKIVLILAAFCVSVMFYSCELDDGGDCAFCKTVTTNEDGAIIDQGVEEEYCLDDLDDKRNTPPITDPEGNVTQWVCD